MIVPALPLRGGADAVVIREFDVASKKFVTNGFILPEAKTEVSWKNRDTLLVGTDFGKDSLTKSGYPRIAKEWKRGTPPAEATLAFEGKTDDVGAERHGDRRPASSGKSHSAATTFFTNETFVRRATS